jgi:Leucine-rich repeat (LRR) protein
MVVSFEQMHKKICLVVGILLALGMCAPASAQKPKPKPKPKPVAKTQPKAQPAKGKTTPATTTQAKPPVGQPAQTNPVVGTSAFPPERLAKYHERIREMVENMEAQFNILGDPDNDLSDKSTIINEAYLDIYRDDKVIVEDDLVDGRSTSYNKNIKSYLQDIATFFSEAKFVLELAKIEPPITTESGQVSFKVDLNRNLSGKTKDGVPVSRTVKRFVEINLVDRAKDDLKIVSVYTSGAGGVVGLQFWWSAMSPEWKALGKNFMGLADTVATEEQLQRWADVADLNLSGQAELADLAPLAQFKNVKNLDISNTKVEDLGPVRDLTKLTTFKAANTRVLAIDALNFLVSLTEISLDGAKITNLKPLTNLVNLERLSLQNTLVRDLAPLAGAAKLRQLNLAGSPVESVAPLAGLANLQTLDLSGAKVTDVAPLAGLSALQELVLDNTGVSVLAPLKNLGALRLLSLDGSGATSLDGLGKMSALKAIYADNTDIKRGSALAHLAANPGSVVVFETASLRKWWKDAPAPWKTVLQGYGKFSGEPTKEQLAQLSNLTELDLGRQVAIGTLEPVKALPELVVLRAAGTAVADVTPLARLARLRVLDLDQTKVADLKPLAALTELEELRLEATPANSFAGLEKLAKLKVLYVDSAAVVRNAKAIVGFIDNQESCLLVYKTNELQRWWAGLSPEWQRVFGQYEKFADPKKPEREGLHRLAALKKLEINGVRINSLAPATILFRLEELTFTDTQINELSLVAKFPRLEVLRCPKNPVGDLTPLGTMQSLRFLDLENTAIDNLEPIAGLTKLRELHFSGTQVKRLKGLESMAGLEVIEFYSTGVSSLKALEALPKLKLIRCHNTKLSKGDIASFKKAQPKCEVEHY